MENERDGFEVDTDLLSGSMCVAKADEPKINSTEYKAHAVPQNNLIFLTKACGGMGCACMQEAFLMYTVQTEVDFWSVSSSGESLMKSLRS